MDASRDYLHNCMLYKYRANSRNTNENISWNSVVESIQYCLLMNGTFAAKRNPFCSSLFFVLCFRFLCVCYGVLTGLAQCPLNFCISFHTLLSIGFKLLRFFLINAFFILLNIFYLFFSSTRPHFHFCFQAIIMFINFGTFYPPDDT